MTRTDAEQQYRTAYRAYRLAEAALRDAQDAVYETRGIDYPYRGPMLNKVHHAQKRLGSIQSEVRTELCRELMA